MTFTSSIFLIGILPWFILISYLLRNKRNAKIISLLLMNSLFYVWGGVGAFFYIAFFSAVVWIFTKILSKAKNRFVLGALITITAFPLILIKYTVFAINNINSICHLNISFPNIMTPIGISFFTFEAISLMCDTYEGRVTSKIPIIETYLYITFFATVTSGPILRFHTFKEGLLSQIRPDDYNEAITRLLKGLCKKVLIADKIAPLADYYFTVVANGNGFSAPGLWIGSVAYTLQLYFDFSGYSDMAIGIGMLLGFRIPENFNHPYHAVSISDFWRRWHISLSQWFRDYIYIPLGGNRCSAARHIFNMLIVWLLTGIWHGADWSFVIWGLGYFLLLVAEKYIPAMKNIGKTRFGHIYTMFFVNLLWIPFRAANLSDTKTFLLGLIGIGTHGGLESIAMDYIPYMAVAIILCCPVNRLLATFEHKKWLSCVKGMAILITVSWAVSAIINASYAPYIYGNF